MTTALVIIAALLALAALLFWLNRMVKEEADPTSGDVYGRWLSVRRIMRPDKDGRMCEYLTRTYLIPRNRWLGVYLHRWHGSDDMAAFHDHPWSSLSVLLRGRLREWTNGPDGEAVRDVKSCLPVLRGANHLHFIELPAGQAKPPITLFITGPLVKTWGFLCRDSGKFYGHREFHNRGGCAD